MGKSKGTKRKQTQGIENLNEVTLKYGSMTSRNGIYPIIFYSLIWHEAVIKDAILHCLSIPLTIQLNDRCIQTVSLGVVQSAKHI